LSILKEMLILRTGVLSDNLGIYILKYYFMSIIYMTISISLLLALGFLVAFIWSVKTGQFEDDYSPSVRMLYDNKKEDSTPDDSEINKENK